MTFKNLFLPLLGMLVVYHCAEMESPFKDVTASCLLKHQVDDRLKGFSASRAVTESLVQLRSPNNCAASTSCTQPSQPWGVWVRGFGVSWAELSPRWAPPRGTGQSQGCGCGQVTLRGTGSSPTDYPAHLLAHSALQKHRAEGGMEASTAKIGFPRVSLG